MAGSVRGIIVDIGGDTSGLQKALGDVNKQTNGLQKELTQVNKLLKFNPSDTEMVTQKQKLLKESINATSERLEFLKNLQEEYIKTGKSLDTENYRALQREIEKTSQKLSDLKNANSIIQKLGTEMENAGKKFQAAGKEIEDLGAKLTTRLTAPITALTTLGVTYNAQMETYQRTFQNFLGSSEKAAAAIEQIKKDAASSPFDVSSLVRANQMLISTGENADESRKTILALADAVTATGGGNDELTRMASNLQQIKNAGKATAMDIRQFAYAGIDVYGILASYTGKTTEEIKKMQSETGITYEMLSGALEKAADRGGKYYKAMSNASETLTGQTNKLKAQFKDAMGELTKSLMPVAKKTVQQITDIVKAFSKLDDKQKESILKIGLLVAAIGPALKIGGTAVTVIGKVVTGTGTLIKALGLLKNGIGTATGPAATLAKTIAGTVSPVGLLTVGIGAAAAGIAIYQKSVYDATKETRDLKNSTADLKDEITREVEQINEVRAATDERVAAGLSELDYVQNLYEELKTLVDENGKVKEGYEDRVNYITGELSKATGIEIENNNGVIDSYKRLQEQIQTTLNRKKVETIMTGQEEKYAEAIENRDAKTREMIETENKLSDAQKDLEKRNNELTQAETELNAVRLGGGDLIGKQQAYDKAKKNLENQQESVNNLSDSYNSLNTAVKDYNDDIATYEEYQKLYMSGTAEDIQKIIDLQGKTVKVNGQTMELSFKDQIKIQQKYRKQAKEEYDKAKENHDDYEMGKSLTTDQEAARRLRTLADELAKMTSTTGENSEEVIEGWKQLAAGSSKIYREKLAEMPEDQRKVIEDMTGVILEKTPDAVKATDDSMAKILAAFDASPEFKAEALANLTSYLQGLEDTELRNLLQQAGIQDVDKVMQGIREGNLGEDEGKAILTSLKTGLENNTITNSLFRVAQGLAGKLTSMFKINASVSGIGPTKVIKLPGFAEGLPYVPYDNFVARLHKGERVLTAEENRKLTDIQNGTNTINTMIKDTGRQIGNTNIVFNVQKMDEANLNACFNYINKKFGNAY